MIKDGSGSIGNLEGVGIHGFGHGYNLVNGESGYGSGPIPAYVRALGRGYGKGHHWDGFVFGISARYGRFIVYYEQECDKVWRP